MSTSVLLLAAKDVELPVGWLAISATACLAIWAAAGVFSPKRINGPPRLGNEERPASIIGILGIGLMAWALAGLLLKEIWLHGAAAPQAGNTVSPQAVVINIAASLAGLSAMLAANVIFRARGLALLGLNWPRFQWAVPLGAVSFVLILPPILCVMSATELNLTCLIEVHDLANLMRVRDQVIGFPHPSYSLLGINNRDLRTSKTDLGTTLRMAELVENRGVLVSESGIHTPTDISKLAAAGVAAVLVGESLLRSDDIAAKINDLFGGSQRGD